MHVFIEIPSGSQPISHLLLGEISSNVKFLENLQPYVPHCPPLDPPLHITSNVYNTNRVFCGVSANNCSQTSDCMLHHHFTEIDHVYMSSRNRNNHKVRCLMLALLQYVNIKACIE